VDVDVVVVVDAVVDAVALALVLAARSRKLAVREWLV